MKQLFLHIGFNKTGSTSLQHCLSQNREVLEQAGFLYPGATQDSYVQNRQHTPLAAALPERSVGWLRPRKREGLKHALPDLLAAIEASPAETVILSSEAFGGLDMTTERVARVRDKLSDFEVFILAYIRRQDSYLLSAYQEGVKNGSTHVFKFKSYRNNQQLAFNRRLTPWREVFGEDNVIIRPFDPRFWPENRLEFDFLDTIGAPRDKIAPLEKPANESLDYRSVEIMRKLNGMIAHLWPDQTDAKRKTLRTAVLRNLRAIEGGLSERAKMVLSSAQSEEMRRYFAEDNASSLAGSVISHEAFFPPAATDASGRIAPEHLPEDLMVHLIALLASTHTRS
ncbi:hypothetical protein [Antarcticimicrobium sediminis]|uniref:Sulfotransferase family protein n=1 Tax=Antarcticimicrobium sediminis TaxID=2546227 RepID=A0A4R5EI93_9RHOB|nr:hypothetical protein [Antarcticimicrobium sediminis]TDE34251.1 hypothetical protein E1B25_20150 [Antarcticimicrobium sediminis]